MKINLNDIVKLKINQKGIDILRKNHDELKATFPKLGEFMPPASDAEGYYHMQLWSVMETFGPHIHIGFNIPIETEIVVPNE
jgi:repressor LexA